MINATDKQFKRFMELRDEAIARFLDKCDFDETAYMTEKELKEYRKLFKLVNGHCMTCGQVKCDKDCPDSEAK